MTSGDALNQCFSNNGGGDHRAGDMKFRTLQRHQTCLRDENKETEIMRQTYVPRNMRTLAALGFTVTTGGGDEERAN